MAVARKTTMPAVDGDLKEVQPVEAPFGRLKPGVEVDIMCSAVMYPGAFVRHIGHAYVEFDSRMGYTVLPWSAISAITFRP